MRKKPSDTPEPATFLAKLTKGLSQIPWWEALLVGAIAYTLFYFGLTTFFAQQSDTINAHPIPFETFIAVSKWIGVIFAIAAITCALSNGACRFSQRKQTKK